MSDKEVSRQMHDQLSGLFQNKQIPEAITFLKSLKPKQRIDILAIRSYRKSSLLHWVARLDNPELMQAMLAGFTPEQRLFELQKQEVYTNGLTKTQGSDVMDVIIEKQNPELLEKATENISDKAKRVYEGKLANYVAPEKPGTGFY